MEYQIIKYSDINPDTLKELFERLSLEYLESESVLNQQIQGFLPAYPDISNWYNKVIQEIKINPNNREMFISLSNENNSLSISGLMILKNHLEEKKICTLRIKDSYQKKGIGSELLEIAFGFLDTKKPLITVPEESVDIFSRIFNKYGFEKKDEIPDLYRKNKIEYIYNGLFK
ncbi:GNAT family N-acetyltransferase [Basfia succiniciproducens]|uniref:N-acetyltransferase domain-containing protein n=1 Tax=Basfia succiniciproducens TaxID=653940 RepID=A0A1G5DZL6_9PAST|nr:GNAT family N-acetyltransferase [Basfia succiniciproducens]QIM69073.1 hypothetical protein A4G13_06570 [Basfia succiniciproducens]SCY20253.1 hypothetical protein SAMN02910354_01836 [Basfia succiniciproducens]